MVGSIPLEVNLYFLLITTWLTFNHNLSVERSRTLIFRTAPLHEHLQFLLHVSHSRLHLKCIRHTYSDTTIYFMDFTCLLDVIYGWGLLITDYVYSHCPLHFQIHFLQSCWRNEITKLSWHLCPDYMQMDHFRVKHKLFDSQGIIFKYVIQLSAGHSEDFCLRLCRSKRSKR